MIPISSHQTAPSPVRTDPRMLRTGSGCSGARTSDSNPINNGMYMSGCCNKYDVALGMSANPHRHNNAAMCKAVAAVSDCIQIPNPIPGMEKINSMNAVIKPPVQRPTAALCL